MIQKRNRIAVFFSAIWLVLRTPVYTWSLVGRVIDAFAFKGFYVFLPKYLSDHYGIPQYKVVIFIGACYDENVC